MYETMGTGEERSPGLKKTARCIAGLDGAALRRRLDTFLSSPAGGEEELIAFRREMHRYPELGRKEFRTTARIRERLEAAGLEPRLLRGGTGLICEFGPKTDAPVIALRADIDALPVQEENDVEYRSEVDGIAHACGHDVHTTVVLGTGLFLAELDKHGLLPGRVRLIFEPAEELLPSGALDVIKDGGLKGVDRIYAVHCWPQLPVGQFGVHIGAITSVCDMVRVKVTGPGGHTSRPQNTTDVVFTLASIATELPAALSRRVDPRSGLSLVWGIINAGGAANRIPSTGTLEGTVRCQDNQVWEKAPELVESVVAHVAGMFNARAELEYVRGVPASVNDAVSVQMFQDAATFMLGEGAVVPNVSSLGADSFGFYQQLNPGAYICMGTRVPGISRETDLHSGDYNPGERCIRDAVKALAGTVLVAQGVALV